MSVIILASALYFGIRQVRFVPTERFLLMDTILDMKNIQLTLEEYKRVCGQYPNTTNGLIRLLKKESKDCPQYKPTEGKNVLSFKDRWQHDYQYESDGQTYSLKSFGNSWIEARPNIEAQIITKGE